MKRIKRMLRYEFKCSLAFLLYVGATVAVINAIWPHTPWWVFIIVGIGGAEAESIWRRLVP